MNVFGDNVSDAELIQQTRLGERSAFAELWRRHSAAGLRVAQYVAGSRTDPEDLLSESFTEIYRILQSGKGPTEAFRPYLYAVIRNLSISWERQDPSITVDEFDDIASDKTPDPLVQALEQSITGTAFTSLPDRWQAVLWYSEVENLKPQEIGPFLGMKANAVSALLFRAREGLRKAWFTASYGQTALPAACATAVELLERQSRKSLTPMQDTQLESHLAECSHCRAVRDESNDARRRLAVLLLPPVVGGGAIASQIFAPIPATAVALPAAPAFFADYVQQGTVAGVAIGAKPRAAKNGNTALVVGIVLAAALAIGASAIAVPYFLNQFFTDTVPAPTAPTPTATPQPTSPAEPDETTEPEEPVESEKPEVSESVENPVIAPGPTTPPRPTTPTTPTVPTTPPVLEPDPDPEPEELTAPTFALEPDAATARMHMSGTGAPGAVVTIRTIPDGIVLGTAVVASDGTWHTEEHLKGANPAHLEFEVVQTDAEGNESDPADPPDGESSNIINQRAVIIGHSVDEVLGVLRLQVIAWEGAEILISRVASSGTSHTVLTATQSMPDLGPLEFVIELSELPGGTPVELFASFDGLPSFVYPGPAYEVTLP